VRRLFAIAWKELLQLRRDRVTLGMMVAIPAMQLLVFGYAINTDVRRIPTVIFDQDRSMISRGIAARAHASTYFDLQGSVRGYGEIERAFRTGQAYAAFVFPPGLEGDLRRGKRVPVQLVLDGSDPQIVGSALSAAGGLEAALTAFIQARHSDLYGRPPAAVGLKLHPLVRYNPDRRTAVFVVPGLVGVILTMTMVMLTAMAVARERERGTLEALIVSPAKVWEIVVGKLVPYVGVGYVQITIVLALGAFAFDVPLRGSLPLLYALSGVFILACLALGLFFSTLAATQQQAMQMSFFFLLPNILLSGFMFPFHAMPAPAQWLAQALPLTHFVRIVRHVLLQGAGFADIAVELWWLCGIFSVVLLGCALRFNKRLL
jgi:ABC-2 type transport system permease protein